MKNEELLNFKVFNILHSTLVWFYGIYALSLWHLGNVSMAFKRCFYGI